MAFLPMKKGKPKSADGLCQHAETVPPVVTSSVPESLLWIRKHVIELRHERGLVRSSVVPQRLRPFHQHFVRIGSQNSHRLLDEVGKRHCPGFVVAAKKVCLHPRRRDLQNLDRRIFELIRIGPMTFVVSVETKSLSSI